MLLWFFPQSLLNSVRSVCWFGVIFANEVIGSWNASVNEVNHHYLIGILTKCIPHLTALMDNNLILYSKRLDVINKSMRSWISGVRSDVNSCRFRLAGNWCNDAFRVLLMRIICIRVAWHIGQMVNRRTFFFY